MGPHDAARLIWELAESREAPPGATEPREDQAVPTEDQAEPKEEPAES